MSECSVNWTIDENDIWRADINGIHYEVYETAPGFQRVRRDSLLIAETYTTEEGKRWAETYDDWLKYEVPNLPGDPPQKPCPEPLPIPENETEEERVIREKADYDAILNYLGARPIKFDDDVSDYHRFPRYPIDFEFTEQWIKHLNGS